jgi:hypothetical protein
MDKLQLVVPSLSLNEGIVWKWGPLVFLVVLSVFYFAIGLWYKTRYAKFRETPEDVQSLLSIMRQRLGEKIDPLAQNTTSITQSMVNKQGIFNTMNINTTALLNWRPLTVRLTGYLGGFYEARDGVFDMDKGIQLCLAQGARAFVLEIDYLDNAPCVPLLLHRDTNEFKRSLNVGSIQQACQSLANRAFQQNLDPVLLILYFRRLPPQTKQRETMFRAVAKQLGPIANLHLGQTERANFHRANAESLLFTSPIVNYQKKILVVTNVNAKLYAEPRDPSESLDYWTNARIWADPVAKNSRLGNATQVVPNGQVAYCQIGSIGDYDTIPGDTVQSFVDSSRVYFKIAMGPVEMTDITVDQLERLMNELGIQCIPLDLLHFATQKTHLTTLKDNFPADTPQKLSQASNPKDVLSFWKIAGWSRKPFSTDPATTIDFVIPTPVTPRAPDASANSNGGQLVVN